MNKKSVRDIMTEKLVKMIEESGQLPWVKPWRQGDRPANISGRPYHGVNVWFTALSALVNGYQSRYWMTAKQCTERGLSFAGQKATQIVFYKRCENKKLEEDDPRRFYFTMRYYNVFNVDQIEGAEEFTPKDPEFDNRPPLEPISAAATMISLMPNAPAINHGGVKAFYAPSLDKVQMPPLQEFRTAEYYYAVLFHELGHSTGHPSRLGRFESLADIAPFGTPDYSREELVAELTSAYLCAETGIESEEMQTNTAAYLKSWIKALKDDTNMIFYAAAKAQAAADYISGNHVDDPEED